MNNYTLIGTILNFTDVLQTNNGNAIRKMRVKSIKKENETEVFEVVMFKDLAENIYHEGDLICIFGKLSANNYPKDENVRYNVNLIASSAAILG